ncbi:MAG TPA: phenylalanine--tRNA ligase subunit beta, partial [Clostridiaceae bacterium]|nr:phenylalanine--tRNA ligase subunit beta [Clostridiaceae bacterium]HCL49875.1 phenylalanine--tRNA ligase subunit beta [Clostridiaceae bacterium]
MIVPYKWLLDYVNIDKSITEVGDELTLSGSKVEEIIENGKEISKVVTGKILSIEKHPNADRLTICKVDIKDEIIQIVTAATNIRVNDIVPVALHGSTLAGGVKIKKGKLRGVESNGMFCSEVELGIADEDSVHGIMILKEGTPIGEDIKEVLGLNGGVIDFEITSNRADCFSVYGIAREAAATFKTKLKPVNTAYSSNDEDINDYLKVEVKDDLCRRYAAKMVKNVVVKDSPEWMQQRLKEAGIRPINNIVDITNYVMVELGQPMHAYNYKFIEGSKIIVRKAEDNEKFKTLDGEERTLNSSMLVIADDKKPVAVAGVMGGENSEIKNDTNTIIFECANFDGTSIRLTSKKLGLRTDASSKFEKDIDPNLVEMAMNRACNLIEELGAGEIVGGTVDVYKNPLMPHKLTVSASWVNKFLGTDIKPEMMKEMLESLEIKTNLIGDELNLVVPTFRQDVKIKEDVAEEIARIYGYNNIPTRKIVGETVEGTVKKDQKL